MSHPDALIWDERYSNNERWNGLSSPRELAIAFTDLLPRNGLVLDVACGTSPTGLHLAERGLRVIALDVSNAALRLAQSRIRKEALPVSLAIMDLTNPWLPSDHFDVILNFYFLSRPLWSTFRKSLKTGGLLFFETFLRGEDMDRDRYLDSLELKNEFEDWELIHYFEFQRASRSADRSDKKRWVAQLVARKPL